MEGNFGGTAPLLTRSPGHHQPPSRRPKPFYHSFKSSAPTHFQRGRLGGSLPAFSGVFRRHVSQRKAAASGTTFIRRGASQLRPRGGGPAPRNATEAAPGKRRNVQTSPFDRSSSGEIRAIASLRPASAQLVRRQTPSSRRQPSSARRRRRRQLPVAGSSSLAKANLIQNRQNYTSMTR